MSSTDDNMPDDERIPEPTIDDDETVTDPVEEASDDDRDDEEPDSTDEDAEDEAQPVAAKTPRGERQFGALRERARLLAEENARLTRERDELRRAPVQPQITETPQQRADRLALLSPEERIQEMVSESLRINEQKTQNLTNQLLDQSDAATFQAMQATNPLARKLANEVERRLQDVRSRGQNLPRTTVFTYLVGERVLAQQGKAKPGAASRRKSQEARPTNSRGDVASPRDRRGSQDTVADLERRFGDVPI